MSLKRLIIILIIFSCNNKKQKDQIIHTQPVDTSVRITYTNKNNPLTKEILTLKLFYIQWSCGCANWITFSDIKKYGHDDKYCIFVEPADSTLNLPDTIGYHGDIVKFTGQFYKEKNYPEGYVQTEEDVEKAKVFRYIKYQILHSNSKNYNKAKP
jgi:hypothetical protein